MKRQLIKANIVEVQADALIYSTNAQLALTGGVGAALMKKCGWGIQSDLHYDESPIQNFGIVCQDEGEFASLSRAARAINANWQL